MKQSSLNNFTASGNLNNEQLDAIWGKGFSKIDFACAWISRTPAPKRRRARSGRGEVSGVDNLIGSILIPSVPSSRIRSSAVASSSIRFGITPASRST